MSVRKFTGTDLKSGDVVTRELRVDRAAIDESSRTVDLAFASGEPYRRWWGIEVLDTKAKSVRLQRLRDGGALLVNHNADEHIGVVENARADKDGKMRATVRFGRSARATEIFQDVIDGVRKHVSVGYAIHDMVLEKKEGDLSTYRVTDWEPYEVSLASVPADATVGVGRTRPAHPEGGKPMSDDTSIAPSTGDVSPEKTVISEFNRDNSQARQQAFKDMASRNKEILAIGDKFAKFGAKELAIKAIENAEMTVQAFRTMVLDLVDKQQAATPPTDTSRFADGEREAYHGAAAREVIQGNVVMFRGVSKMLGSHKSDQEIAYRAGKWCQAVIGGNADALRWCKDAGVALFQGSAQQFGFGGQRAMTEGIFTSAGWLVPQEMEAGIILNREQYGVARRVCNVVPMTSATTSLPRVTSGVTAYFITEGGGSGGTQSDPAGDQVQLNLKDLMAYTQIGKSTASDTAIPLAEMVAREQARAFAVKEDACFVIGDGTSTYGGMMGVKTLLDLAGYAGGKIAAASGHDTFAEIDNADVTSLIGKMPVYARAGARWLVSGVFDAMVFGRLKLTAGGNTVQTVQGTIVEQEYAGFSITIAHDLPAGGGTTYNGVTIALLGNFALGSAFGSGTGMMMTVDPYTNAHLNLTRIITTERIDIVNHGVNKSTTVAGPICGLHGTT